MPCKCALSCTGASLSLSVYAGRHERRRLFNSRCSAGAAPPHPTHARVTRDPQARGVSKDAFAKIAVALFPFEIAFAFMVGRITDQQRPLKQWTRALVGRLLMSLCGTVVVFLCPVDAKENGLPLWYFSVVAAAAVCNSLAGAVTFTSMSAFFTRIGDPAIGGTCVLRLHLPRQPRLCVDRERPRVFAGTSRC